MDDDEVYIRDLMRYVFNDDDVIEYFNTPDELKKNIENYPKDTRVYLDNHFKSASIKGTDIAKWLHSLGFTRLYLLSGDMVEGLKRYP